jgi:hypothetical protein
MSEWQPIKTAPRDGTLILGIHATVGPFYFLADWRNGQWHDDCGTVHLTHWMPLPPPPVSGEFLGKTPEKWSERLDSNQRPLSPQETDGG